MEDLNSLKEENQIIKDERDFYKGKIDHTISFLKGSFFVAFIILVVFLLDKIIFWILEGYKNYNGFQWFEIIIGLGVLIGFLKWIYKWIKFNGESVAEKWYLNKFKK